MAKLHGPLFSLQARGMLGKVLYYAQNRLGAYCTAFKKKKDPKSYLQLLYREIYYNAVLCWNVNEQNLQTTWWQLPGAKGLVGYYYFISQYVEKTLDGEENPGAPRLKYFSNWTFDHGAYE